MVRQAADTEQSLGRPTEVRSEHPKPTGFWHNWYGDAEGIVRETFARAIEVSLGIPHDKDMTDPGWIRQNRKRTWPIEIFTRCPAPWFEGWVTWRGNSPAHGHVTVHIHTPSHENSVLLTSPLGPGYTIPEYRDEIEPVLPLPPGVDPKPKLPYGGEHGMWVIAHTEQKLVPLPSSVPVVLNGPVVAGNGPVVAGPSTTGAPTHVDGAVVRRHGVEQTATSLRSSPANPTAASCPTAVPTSHSRHAQQRDVQIIREDIASALQGVRNPRRFQRGAGDRPP